MGELFLGEYVIDISKDGIIDVPDNFKTKLSKTKHYFVSKDSEQEILYFSFDDSIRNDDNISAEKYLYNGKEFVVPLEYRKMFESECYLVGVYSKIELYNKKSKEKSDLFFEMYLGDR